MTKNNQKKQETVRKTVLAVFAFVSLAAMINPAFAEESSPIEISSENLDALVTEKVTTQPAAPAHNPLSIGVTPLVGLLRSADHNQLLWNNYSSGVVVDFRLAPNVSIEGLFRYARYNVRPDLVIRDGSISKVSAAFRHGVGVNDQLDRLGLGIIGDMEQLMMGGNIKYELFPYAILTPYIGGGMVYFNNQYSTDSMNNFVRITLPQNVYGGNAIGGLKLRLSGNFAIVVRGEVGTLLNNKNGSLFYRYGGNNAQVYHFQNFRSYDRYYAALAGLSFGM